MRNRKHIALAGAVLALLLALPVGCGQTEPGPEPAKEPVTELTFQDIYMDSVSLSCEEIDIADEAVALSGAPALDPTLASSGNQSEAIMKYIGNGSNYKVRWAF